MIPDWDYRDVDGLLTETSVSPTTPPTSPIRPRVTSGVRAWSKLELLPTELLDEIRSYLKIEAHTKLLRCSKLLQERIEPRVYGRKAMYNRALHWACQKNFPGLIDVAVRYGASIDVVCRKPSDRYQLKPGPSPHQIPRDDVPTLCVAAATGSVDAFRYLLELGARVLPEGVDPRHATRLSHHLRRPKNRQLLSIFLEHHPITFM
jgi:hypothetical protein